MNEMDPLQSKGSPMTVTPALLDEFSSLSDPADLLKALHNRFGGRMAIATAGQLTESAIVGLCVEAGFKPRVFTIDTGRLFRKRRTIFPNWKRNMG
jgi:3'-phosphoadenosine 5'-phosphosulfate sulfotransferase (PAPS reductase)/FAD synthetase